MSKADKTKQFIIEQTAKIFNIKGFAGTSLSDITGITGLTKGSVYGNFKNKDDVAIEAFKYNFNMMKQLFVSEMAKVNTNREKLLVYTEVLSDFSESKFPIGGCPILNTAVESDDTHPILKQLAKKTFVGWIDQIVGVLVAGIEAGEFNPKMNTEQVAITILASLEGSIMIRKLTDNQEFMRLSMRSLQKYIHQL